MKKLYCLMLVVLAAAGCINRQNSTVNDNTVSYVVSGPDAAYYSDWDKAIRYDAAYWSRYGIVLAGIVLAVIAELWLLPHFFHIFL